MKNSLPLYKQIIMDLLEQILDGELRPGDRVPSEHELSNSYRVSSITSKNALTELAEKGYIVRIKGKGSFVNSAEALLNIPDFTHTLQQRIVMKAKTIGLIVPSMKTTIDQQLLNAVEMELAPTEYILAISITRESQQLESASIQKFRESGVSGLIIFPTEHEMYNEEILKLNLSDFPFVLVDRYLRGIRSSCIYTDNYDISKLATLHLLEQGCRHVAFLSPDSHNTVTSDRINGFQDGLYEQGMTVLPENLCMIPLSVTDPAEKESLILQYLKSHPDIDGLFCVNREMTKYAAHLMTIHQLWDRYRIAAFDYPDDHRISYISQDIEQIAHNCVVELIDSIQNGRKDHHIVVPARLVPAHTFSYTTKNRRP